MTDPVLVFLMLQLNPPTQPPVSIFGTTDLAAPFMLQQPSTAATLTITQ